MKESAATPVQDESPAEKDPIQAQDASAEDPAEELEEVPSASDEENDEEEDPAEDTENENEVEDANDEKQVDDTPDNEGTFQAIILPFLLGTAEGPLETVSPMYHVS